MPSVSTLYRLLIVVVVLALPAVVRPDSARADGFDLPGLSADSQTYARGLQRRHPAGGTPQARAAAERAASTAEQRGDTAAQVAALEERASLGGMAGKQWHALAAALLRLTPPDGKRALAAAWQDFQNAEAGEAEIPGLLLVAEALRVLGRADQAALTLEQVVQRAPDDTGYRRQLAEAQRAAGVTVRRVRAEGEAQPPRACVTLSVPPRRDGFDPQDWVRLDPPIQGAAVTREGDQICASGLPSGQTVRMTLRAGLPAQQGLALAKDVVLAVAIPDRRPNLAFDTRLFVLPRGQAPAVTLSTVNLSAVSLKLMRLTERATVAFLRDNRLGGAVERYAAAQIGDSLGSTVWQGRAEVPNAARNTVARTALPIPDPLRTAGPGLYALMAEAGDGTPDVGASVQMILRTDLAPTVWRGSDGLIVQVRSYADARVRSGVHLQLLARNNDALGEATTDADGVARFPVSLLHGEGPLAPAAVQAFGDDQDFATLDLTAASFDLSDRGVAGAPSPGPLDAFVWLDRGIYRPGETVQAMALLRDAAGRPADVPVQVTVKRPNGQVFFQTAPPRGPEASFYQPVTLGASAPAGTWTIELRADPAAAPIGRAEFRVDAFVPDRMAVDVGPVPAALVVGRPTTLPVAARFLYGAPGAGLTGKATLDVAPDPDPFPALGGYRFGLADETATPEHRDIPIEPTDTKGQTSIPLALDRVADQTRPLRAEIGVEIDDPSGHGSRAAATVPVRGAAPFIGLKPLFADGAVDDGAEAAFDAIAVAPDGARTTLAAKLRLVREVANWRLVRHGSIARYETVYRDEPLETRDVTLGTGAPLRIARALGFGRYRLELAQAGGMAVTSLRFRAGWSSSDSPDVPDRVDVSADRRSVAAGEVARIHITSPFAGEATLLVLTDRVHEIRTLSVPLGGADVEVRADAAWGPGAYVAVHVFRGGEVPAGTPRPDRQRPDRAIGLVWLGLDPATRTLPVSVAAEAKYVPRQRVTVPVRTAPGAWVTLAAVDEGILRLTSFPSPDPAAHFLGRRRLGIDIRDDWGRLIAPAEGDTAVLRQGGDEGSFVLPDIPQHTVTLFAPPMQAGADGIAAVPLDLPDFNGQVRLMAVAWQGDRIGAGSAQAIVRDALVVEPLLPRFLAPGDTARLAVLMHDLDLPGGDATVRITTSGPLAVAGASTLGATLAAGGQVIATTALRATGAGRGVIGLDVTGPAGFTVHREAAITLRPSRGAVSTVAGGELAPGAEAALGIDRASYVFGTLRASASFGAPVRYDPAALVRSLADYPLSCLEQATSRGLPLALLPDGEVAGADRAGRLQAQVGSVLDRQRYDGGFALWTASGDEQPWLSAYATEFILRARRAGAAVADRALDDALHYLADAAANESGDEPAGLAAQAYRLYVLALAERGKPGLARVLAEQIGKLPTPLARAQLAAALALAHDTPAAEAAFTAALDAPARKFWYADYGSALRDSVAIAVLLKESGLLPGRLDRLVATLPGADLQAERLTTQEAAWAASAAAVLGRGGRPARIAIDGKALDPAPLISVALDGPATARNLGDRPVWQSVAARGVPLQAPAASRNLMRISRRFFALDGTPLDLDHLAQNTVFVLLLEGRAEDGQEHQAMVLQGLPAGWEVAGRLGEGAASGMAWLGALTAPDAEPAADDRFAAVLHLTADKPEFRVAVRLRAVTPGEYEIPGAEASDMYRPAIAARQGVNRIKVLAAE